MKTLVINGSPRKNGDSVTLTNELLKHLDGEVIIINTYYDEIQPCLDCRYCWNNIGCIINDKMQEVYSLINEVDNIILSSPIYFSELTGSLLSVASRLQCYYAMRCIQNNKLFQLKKKRAVLIICGGGDGSTDPAINSAKTVLRHINAELIGVISSLNTNKISAKDDILALEQAREYAAVLNVPII